MFHDLQYFPGQGDLSHVGSPSATVECKLIGVSEEDVAAIRYRGEVSMSSRHSFPMSSVKCGHVTLFRYSHSWWSRAPLSFVVSFEQENLQKVWLRMVGIV